ncbi:hypothetical protein [Neorhizobium galegae]|uniref:hypothetical protein n=1 Tax=Neorhizobium galegae TaxID=399 RepID=UPI00351F1636
MSKPLLDDGPPLTERVSAYDEAHFATYLRLLDAAEEGVDWREATSIIFGLDVAADPEREEAHMTEFRVICQRTCYRSAMLDGHIDSQNDLDNRSLGNLKDYYRLAHRVQRTCFLPGKAVGNLEGPQSQSAAEPSRSELPERPPLLLIFPSPSLEEHFSIVKDLECGRS